MSIFEEISASIVRKFIDDYPDKSVLLVAVTQEQAHKIAELCVEGSSFERTARKTRYKSTNGGVLTCAGLGGALLGIGADLIVTLNPFSDGFNDRERREEMTLHLRMRLRPNGSIVQISGLG